MSIYRKSFFLFLLLPYISIAHNDKKYDAVAIGKAMVDIIKQVSEQELIDIMPKNFIKTDSMRIKEEVADKMFAKITDPIIIPGGSEANVMVDMASLGAKTAFNGAIADDKLGKIFIKSLEDEGVDFLSPVLKDLNLRTARCFAFITPDKNRTFAVSASIADLIDDSSIDYKAIENSKVFYSDASNLDDGKTKSNIIQKAFETAKKSSTTIVFNLNNNYYVEKHRQEIIRLLPQTDIIIGGEKEILNLFKMKSLDSVIDKYLEHVKILVVTQDRRGAVIATKDDKFHIASVVEGSEIVDLNGAGDAFAAGFLYGYTHNYALKQSAALAAKVAAEIIYQVGPRPKSNMRNLIK